MKKVLLWFATLSFVAAPAVAMANDTLPEVSNPMTTVVVDSAMAASLIQKIDEFDQNARSVREQLRDEDWQERRNHEQTVMMVMTLTIMVIVFGTIIFWVYMFFTNNYRRNKLKYETMVRFAEMGRDFPASVVNHTNVVQNVGGETSHQQLDDMANPNQPRQDFVKIARPGTVVPLVLAILSGVMSLVWLICCATARDEAAMVFLMLGLIFAGLSIWGFIVYFRRNGTIK